jgi:hypothetical protein
LLLIYLNQLSQSCEKDIKITEFASYALAFPGGQKEKHSVRMSKAAHERFLKEIEESHSGEEEEIYDYD